MTSPLPTPLAAAIGIVPALLDRARRLPGRAVQLPVLAVSNALTTMDALRKEYDDLAVRGEHLVARLRGRSVATSDADDPTGTGTAASGYAPDAGVAVRATDAASSSARTLADLAPAARTGTGTALEDASAAIADISGAPVVSAPVAPPAPPAPARIDTAASASVQQAVEQVVETVAGATEEVAHDDLPLPDYDHMTLGSLRGRLRALSVEQLVAIRTYEKAHADRLPVVTMLDNRIAKLSSDSSATPSGPVSDAPAPEQQALADSAPRTGVSPATTTALTINPPSQGDPTNPAQPR